VDDQLASVHLAVEPPVGESEEAKILERNRTAGAPRFGHALGRGRLDPRAEARLRRSGRGGDRLSRLLGRLPQSAAHAAGEEGEAEKECGDALHRADLDRGA
jgi:hypothetical protein